MAKAHKIRFTGKFASSDAAASTLTQAGDVALVHRGVGRLLLMNCPCGCGDTLVINLDHRAGPAWRIYQRGTSLSLYPSYWRDTKCESHFILWRNAVYWCNWDDESTWTSPSTIEEQVLAAMPEAFINYQDLAEQMQEVPWDVLQACHSLVRKGVAAANHPDRKGEFRRLGKGR